VKYKREIEILGKEIVEGDPLKWWERVVDPEIGELRGEIVELRNTVRTLQSLIKTSQLPEVGKRVARAAQLSQADIEKARHTDEKPRK